MLPISVVVLSHNRVDEIKKNLPVLAELVPEIELIVVDNASSDGSREYLQILKQEYPDVHLVLNDKNLGVAGGRNSGFLTAKRSFIIALDDDTSLPSSTLQAVPDIFAHYPRAGILAFKIVHPLTGELQNDHGDQPYLAANHHGAGFAIRTELFKTTGGIDEECNFGAEELDFAIKVRVHGLDVLYLPELIAYHNSLPRNENISQFRRIRREYNNVRVYFKYFPLTMAIRNSFRYLFWTLNSWRATFGIKGLHNLPVAAAKGMLAGMRNKNQLPDVVVDFYNNPLLQPEFGNAPTVRKSLRKKISSILS